MPVDLLDTYIVYRFIEVCVHVLMKTDISPRAIDSDDCSRPGRFGDIQNINGYFDLNLYAAMSAI